MPLTYEEQHRMYDRMMFDRRHVLEMRVRQMATTAVDSGLRRVCFPFLPDPGYVRADAALGPVVSFREIQVLVPGFPEREAALLVAEASIRRDVLEIVGDRT